MAEPQDIYRSLIKSVREIALLSSTSSLLGWDERTQMPPDGAEHRANQSSLIARMCHEQFTAPEVGRQIGEIEQSSLVQDADSDEATNIRELRRDYDRKTKVPASLVEELARIEVLSQAAWVEARKQSNFSRFQPWLQKIVALKTQEAQCIGCEGSPYNALLDEYEPRERVSQLNEVFAALRQPLINLIRQIGESPRKAPVQILHRHFPIPLQERFTREVAERIGFGFNWGRIDISVHPFCSTIGPGDTRITTRYNSRDFGDAFFSVMHEVGHALYGQGLPREHWGTPRGRYISLGIHESQSRLWENFVARSRSFWSFFLPRVEETFGVLSDVSLDQWYFAVNNVRPGFIRTESDETTYNLHILLRFELEQAMLTGDLAVADIPSAWNQKMKTYLGLTPPDDAQGCLQDIHWSIASLGYFPTYTLGNLYAAQFFEQARKDLGDLDAMFAAGDFAPLLKWLREKIHRHGRRYTARDLVRRVTGKPLSAEPLLKHLKARASDLYGV